VGHILGEESRGAVGAEGVDSGECKICEFFVCKYVIRKNCMRRRREARRQEAPND